MSVTADQHFAIIPEWVLYADISAQAVRLYATLARHANKGNGHGHPGRLLLAKETRTSVKTVDRSLKELAAIGAVRVRKRFIPGTKERTSNDYHLPTARSGPTTGGGNGDATSGDASGATEGTHMTQELESLERESSERESEELGVVVHGRVRWSSKDEFDEFWSAYPRKVGKPKARSAFAAAVARALPSDVIAGAERLRDDPNRDPSDAFTPHPTTWLNRDGWEDPPLPSRNGKGTDMASRLLAEAARGREGAR